MASSYYPITSSNQIVSNSSTRTVFRWVSRPQRILLRRRKSVQLPTVRLGGKKKKKKSTTPSRRKLFMIRRLKVRWLKLKLKKLKRYYQCVVKEAGGSIDSFQHRLLMETSFMALSLNTFPNPTPL